jgi:hypothetical protein
MRSAIIFIFLLFFFININAHPIHVSIVNMDVNRDSGSINYSIRLFYDDFQRLINSKYNTQLDFDKEKRISLKEQQYILEYLNSSFIIYDSNQTVIKAKFLSWKIENLSVWFYFGTNFNSNMNKLVVFNTLMNEIFTDQKNMFIINTREKEQGFEFNLRNTKYAVSII